MDSAVSGNARTVRIHWLSHLANVWRRASHQSRLLLSIYFAFALAQISATVAVLFLGWTLPCDRPLQVYLIAHLSHTTVATPFAAARYLRRQAANTEEPRWIARLATVLDIYSTVIFLLGNYLLIPSTTCRSTNPPVFILSVVFIALTYVSILLPFFVCLLVIFCLPLVLFSLRGSRWEAVIITWARGDRHVAPTGLSEEDIAKLPLVRAHSPTSTLTEKQIAADKSDSASTVDLPQIVLDDQADHACSICLESYEDGVVLRQLPCSHLFHDHCVDTWLRMNNQCPLCKQSILKSVDEQESSTADDRV